ncbi:MAG: hypothetical protein JST00_31880 [Deltaproteobacteria bacterium]|nr:hypothetical protein [Deltaproteobacteria bacterium]
MLKHPLSWLLAVLVVLGPAIGALPACSSDDPATPAPSAPTSLFEPDADFAAENAFFSFPYPSDLRLTAEGTPDVAAFPDQGIALLAGIKKGAGQRKGFPMLPVGYFTFTAKLEPRSPDTLIEGGATAAIALLDIDPASPERGKAYPVVAQTMNKDPYMPEHLLAIAARPGIVLPPSRKLAFVVTKNVGFEGGAVPAAPRGLAALAKGEVPEGPKGARLRDLYAPLWETLDKVAVAKDGVIAATVFTTGDVVADNEALGDKVLAAYKPDLTDFALDTVKPIAEQPDLCHIRAKIVLPQFQKGTPIYNTEGLFEMGPDGLPIKQRDETIPVSIAIPRREMPAGGYPLVLYFHGSGGVSRQLIDGGDPGDPPLRWVAPTMAKRGFASAGSALPISPERVPNAAPIDYVNVNNLVAVRDTFRQGILESRLLLSALERARIPPSALGACTGPTLPAGETAFRFAENPHAQGQSMGGMYTNLVSACEKRIKLSVPTGAGGYWVYFLLRSPTVPQAPGLLALLIRTEEKLTFLHPVLQLGETAIEPIDPIVSAVRVGRRPLPGHPARPIYEPTGVDDSYFKTEIFDAMVLAYQHPRVGDEIWPSMREAQKLAGVDQPISYPVKANLKSENGSSYTGAVVQYSPLPEGTDGHSIHYKKDAVMQQYGCFHETFRKSGVAVISPPGPIGAPCAE